LPWPHLLKESLLVDLTSRFWPCQPVSDILPEKNGCPWANITSSSDK
jgi:hypothetical protein